MMVGANGKKSKYKNISMNMAEKLEKPGAHTLDFGDGISLQFKIKIIPADPNLHKDLIEKQQ